VLGNPRYNLSLSTSSGKPTCFFYEFDPRRPESIETKTCRIGQGSLFKFGRHVKTTYFTAEVMSSEIGLT
jgi:E3 ubiquitin-protein ligase TRIP12